MESDRKQFTFYRSYYEAVERLNKRDRLAALDAILGYALDGVEPVDLTPVQFAVFHLVRPTLDAGRRKAMGGMHGKEDKGKPGASSAQDTDNEKEIEKEKEIETEIEKEIEIENKCKESEREAGGFDDFWASYPRKLGKDQARAAWEKVKGESAAILAGLERWKHSSQWLSEDGRYIPRPARFLLEGYFRADCPPERGTRRLDGDEVAAIHRMMREEV